jgi:serine/threonine protein kinase
VLTDFGIARATGTDVTQVTNVGMIIGSPRYVSPEQCMSRPLDANGIQLKTKSPKTALSTTEHTEIKGIYKWRLCLP